MNFQKHCVVLLHPPAIFLVQEYGDEKLRSPVSPHASPEKKRRETFKQLVLLLPLFRGDTEEEAVLHTARATAPPCPIPSATPGHQAPATATLPGGPHGHVRLPISEGSPKSTSPAPAHADASLRGTPDPPSPMSAQPSLCGRPGLQSVRGSGLPRALDAPILRLQPQPPSPEPRHWAGCVPEARTGPWLFASFP